MDQFQTLIKVARDLRQQGCYLQAAKCLEAACGDQVEALPTSRAVACLDYAELLMDHFDNTDHAKKFLLKADLELRSARTHQALRCEVFHHLIRCQSQIQDYAQAIDACRSGIKVCTQDAANKKELGHWHVYFLFRLAECHFHYNRDPIGALKELDRVESISGLSCIETATAAISRAVLNLQCGNMDAADQQLTACATTLESMMNEEDGTAERLRAEYFLLYAVTAQSVGRAAQLQQNNDYPVFTELQQALHATAASECMQSGWLPGAAMAALGHMLHASVLRASGKGSAAAVQLGQAEELVDQALALNRITWSASQENNLTSSVLAAGKVYIRLKAALIEQRALAALLTTDLAVAAGHLGDLLAALTRYPDVLEFQAPSACALLGHYAHTVEENKLAMSLFDAVLASPAKHLHKLAAISATLSDIQCGGSNNACSRMEDRGIGPGADIKGLPSHERAAAQLVQGIMLRANNDGTGARLLLTKALKQAHSLIGSTQLVGQILNVLAPVQQEKQDVAGAKQMYESATTLLKSVGDLPSLVTALRGMHALHLEQGDEALAEKSQQYLQRKAGALHERLKEVKTSKEHKDLVRSAEMLRLRLVNRA